MRASASRSAAFLAVAAHLLVSCRAAPPPVERPHVVMVLIDTLRADRLGAYGYPRPTSPTIDRLASQGIVFEDAVSAASATFPSVNSLFTATDSDPFLRSNSEDLGIPAELDTLAEVLQRYGYRTAAVSASPIVRRSPSAINPGGGFGQGFERFDESCGDPRFVIPGHTSSCVTERALAALGELGGPVPATPFFLYVHYLDPHDPYQPPGDPAGLVRPYAGNRDFVPRGETWPFIEFLTTGAGDGGTPSAADLSHLMDLYDAEVRAVDAGVARLVEELEHRGLVDRTLLVILSDHGESFLENGVLQHSYSLYQTELHIPWILHWRGHWSRARRIAGPACSVDVMPTVVALAGLPPPLRVDGVPLLDTEGRRIGPPRMCMASGRSSWRDGLRTLAALRSGSFKLIHDSERARWELYDVARDPGEQRSLIADPSSSAWLQRYFRAALERRIAVLNGRGRPGSKHIALTSEAEQALRALGYVE